MDEEDGLDYLDPLQRLGERRFLRELYLALVDVTHDVVSHGRAGSVSVTLVVTQPVKGVPQVIVAESITRRPPKDDPRGAAYWAVDGGLHREDPRQTRLELRTLPSGQTELRAADGEPVMREAE